MARCPECGTVATGCDCSVIDTDCFEITGSGSEENPFGVQPILDPDTDNLASCGPSGFLAVPPSYILDPPATSVFRSIATSIPNDTTTVIEFSSENYDTDTMHCVDEATEILTGRGWVTYDQLLDEDEVLTLNHSTGLSEWQNLTALHVYEARPRTLMLMEGKNHSSLTTPGHRWPVIRARRDKTRKRQIIGRERVFTTTEKLQSYDQIPIAAECADLPRIPKWEDDFVELVAWFWTEGHFAKLRSGEPSNTAVIVQSHKANPAHCERISAVLHRLFGPPVTSFGRQGSRHDGAPKWKVSPIARDSTAFSLNAAIGKLLHATVPEKVVPISWLRELTRSQLEMFVQVSMFADNSGPHSLGQKSQQAVETFQVAVLLSGRGSSLRSSAGYERPPGPSRFDGISIPKMWHATLLRNTVVTPGLARYEGIFAIRPIAYNGVVWCPETPNQTWLARREGRVYFTGNSTVTNPSRITFTTGGIYIVTFVCQWDKDVDGDRAVYIRKNGLSYLGIEAKHAGDADLYVGHSLTIVDNFGAGSYVEALVRQDSGAALNLIVTDFSPTFTATFRRRQP